MPTAAAAQLRKARAKSHRTPAEMAELVGLTVESYRDIEAGRARPDRPTAVRIHSATLAVGLPVSPHEW